MIIEILLFAMIGCIIGVVTGIIPGLHVNTVAVIIIPFAGLLNPYLISVAIISLAISHTFFDFIPSIFLGAPEESTALSVLPGHNLLLSGKGMEALYLTVVGGLVSVFIVFLLSPIFIILLPFFYQSVSSYIHLILITVAAIIIISEKGIRKLYAFFIFMLVGGFGIIVMNTHFLPSYLILFPVFTGLFGLNNLLISLNRMVKIPYQKLTSPKISKKISLIGSLKGIFSGVIVGTLPGVGASQAALITQQITRKFSQKEFLVSIGSINTIVALFSLISLYTISKPRSGAAIAVQELLPHFGSSELVMLLGTALLSAGISSLVLLKITKSIIKKMQEINYRKLTMIVIFFIIALTSILTGLYGLLILSVSTSLGLLAPLYGVKRSNSMAVLMVPIILFYSGITII